jgi:hypothetical protein
MFRSCGGWGGSRANGDALVSWLYQGTARYTSNLGWFRKTHRHGGLEVAQTEGCPLRASSKMEEREREPGGYREPQDAAWSSRQPGYDEI